MRSAAVEDRPERASPFELAAGRIAENRRRRLKRLLPSAPTPARSMWSRLTCSRPACGT